MIHNPEPLTPISDSLPDPIKVVVASATGVIRAEILAAFDEDFEVLAVADVRQAGEAATHFGPHALVVVMDDLVNCTADDLVSRVRVAATGSHRVACFVLMAHGEEPDLTGAYHCGGDDVARWPLEPDMLRARLRSLVRAAGLEASMTRKARSGKAGVADLKAALAHSVHLINNSVAGISGRAQLVALTGGEDAGLVPVCLSESRKMTLVLSALHRLAESVTVADEQVEENELATTSP